MDIRQSEDVFLDFGSGMGRACIIAAMFPFHKIIGVEVCPKLNQIACANVSKALKKLKCKNIELIQVDAAEYNVPSEVNFVYFFNPFGRTTLNAVLDNIRASLRISHRKITIIFKGPYVFEGIADNCSWLAKQAEYTKLTAQKYVVYESVE